MAIVFQGVFQSLGLRHIALILSILTVAGCKPDCDVTDDDVIRKSVDYYLSVQNPTQHWTYPDKSTKLHHLKLYSSYDELVGGNPDCCRIAQSFPDFGGPSIWQRWWYDFRGYVLVSVSDRRIVETGIELYQRSSYVSAVDSCGDRIEKLNY